MFQVNKVPGFAFQMRRDSYGNKSLGPSHSGSSLRRVDKSPSGRSSQDGVRTRENSPKMPRPRSEEIPLEDMRLRKTSLTSNSSSSHEYQEVPTTSGNGNGNSEPSKIDTGLKKRSEETSFMEQQTHESRPRRKGQVETV